MTEQAPTVTQALSAVMGDIRAVGKDSVNQQQHFNFRGIDAVVNAVSPVLRKHGVIVTPDVRMYEHGTVLVGGKQTPMGHARVIVTYTFHGPAGDTITCSAPGEAMDSGDKATAKAMSVAFRTALLQALALPTTEVDPDAQVYERSTQERAQGQQRQQRGQDGSRQHQARPPQQSRPQQASPAGPAARAQQTQDRAPQGQPAKVTPASVRTQIQGWARRENVAPNYVLGLFDELHPSHGGWDHHTVETETLNAFFLTLQKRVKQSREQQGQTA